MWGFHLWYVGAEASDCPGLLGGRHQAPWVCFIGRGSREKLSLSRGAGPPGLSLGSGVHG